ncbi:ester cyclase [Geodermatophilus sp. SYSU D00815]
MSDVETREVMEAYLRALLDRADFAAFFAPDVLWTTMETGEQLQGRDAVRDLIVAFHTQLFDARPELHGLVFGDGVAMAEARFVGTHRGDFAGVPATGRQVDVPYCMAYDVRDGAITALRAYLPVTAMVAQLTSAQPAPA